MSDPIDLTQLVPAIDWWDSVLMDPEGHEPMPVPEGKGKHIHAFVNAGRAVLNANQSWKCVSHNCDVNDLSDQRDLLFDPAKEYCSIESEWGSLDPKNCEIVRGVFVPVKH